MAALVPSTQHRRHWQIPATVAFIVHRGQAAGRRMDLKTDTDSDTPMARADARSTGQLWRASWRVLPLARVMRGRCARLEELFEVRYQHDTGGIYSMQGPPQIGGSG